MAILCLFQTVFCQALQPGDPIPEGLTITGVQNSPVSEIQLRDLKGKLVILDFWSTWCTACIAAFPKLHQLQKEFKDEVKIILVNTHPKDSAARVNSLFAKRKERTGEGVELPFSLQQEHLKEVFPYEGLPHVVWISPDGKYLGASYSEELNVKNIQAALQNRSLGFLYKSYHAEFDYKVPLFMQKGKILEDNILLQSTITPFLPGIRSVISNLTLDNDNYRLCILNYPLLFLYRYAFEIEKYPHHWMVFETSKYNSVLIPDDNWDPRNTNFCYELILPVEKKNQVRDQMRVSLEMYFGLTIKREPRTVKVLELVPPKQLPTGSKNTSASRIVTLEYLRSVLDLENNFPVVCSYSDMNATISLPADVFKLDNTSRIKLLQKNGFSLRPLTKSVQMWVFTDMNPSF